MLFASWFDPKLVLVSLRVPVLVCCSVACVPKIEADRPSIRHCTTGPSFNIATMIFPRMRVAAALVIYRLRETLLMSKFAGIPEPWAAMGTIVG